MICRKCGAEFEEDSRFCPSCGSPLDEQAEPEDKLQEAVIGEEPAGEASAEEKAEPKEDAVSAEPKEDASGEASVQAGQTADTGGAEADWQAASRLSTDLIMEKPKNNDKAPFIVMGVIGAAILAAAVFLVLNLTGVGSPKAYVRKAFINTCKELVSKDEYTEAAEALMADGLFSEKIGLTVSDVYLEEYGLATSLPIPETCWPLRFSLSTISGDTDGEIAAELSAGLGDMKDVRLEMFADKKGYLIGLPDLYDKYVRVSADTVQEMCGWELDLDETLDTDESQQAVNELEKILVQWAASAYSAVDCEKTEKAAVNAGDREISAQEYVLTISRADFQKHMRKLPKMLEENTVFMDWLSELYSEQAAEEFIKSLKTLAEEITPKASVSKVVLAYVYISDGRIIQAKVPTDLEEPDSGRVIEVSLFGEEKLADNIRISMDSYETGEEFILEYTVLREENSKAVNFNIAMDGGITASLSMDIRYETADSSCGYSVRNAKLKFEAVDSLDRRSMLDCDFSLECKIEKADGIRMPDWEEAIEAESMTDEEMQEMVMTILGHAVNGGYIPSEYVSDIEELLSDTWNDMGDDFGTENGSIGDDASGSLDGSENLTYEEFAAMVKETYGDLYSEEDLRILYDSIYSGGAEYDTSGIVYGPSGLPYLFCMDEDLIIELQPVDGFIFSTDYSDAYTVEYEKASETDLIVMSYSITTESMEEHMEWEADYQKQYYEDAGYKFEMSEIKRGVINTHSVSWIEYYAADDIGNTSQGIIAYAQLDDKHGCALDMYSIWGEEEITEDLLYECFKLYYIEN